jgi:Cu+-exporting ATPase
MSEPTIDRTTPASAPSHDAAVIDLPVLGMTCAACVRRVERAVSALPGVSSAEVNLPLSRARITGNIDAHAAAAAIRDAGYEVPDDVLDTTRGGQARLEAISRAEAAEARTLKRDAITAIAVTVPLLALAMSHVDVGAAGVIAQLVMGTFVVLVPGRHYLRRGAIAVRHKSPDMNTLIALGAGAAWLSSTVTTLRWLAGPRHHMPEIYFEAGAAIVAFVMIGKLLEARARGRVSQAVRGLMSLAPTHAHKADGDVDTDVEVDATALVPGDVVMVRPGERLPADGTLIEGRSTLDESMLTGESLPVTKEEGAPVYAGTLNQHGVIKIRVARAGADTSLARIARAVEDAQGSKAAIARLADRVSAVFVPAVLAIAALTFLGWFATGHDATTSLARMIAVLVIACPCALGLATPAAVAVGTARGAELGLLFRGGDALERASHIDVVCLDKTGTLTMGRPQLVGDLPDDVLAIAAAAEQHSEHPVARAIVDAAKARGLSLPAARDVSIVPGGGLTATVNGKRVKIGTTEFVGAGIEAAANMVAGANTHVGAAVGAGANTHVGAAIKAGPNTHVGSTNIADLGTTTERGANTHVGSTNIADLGTNTARGANTYVGSTNIADLGTNTERGANTHVGSTNIADLGTNTERGANTHVGSANTHVGAAPSERGGTFITIDGVVAGAIDFVDPAAAGAAETVAKLRALGIEPVMITGDRKATAERIAADVGITRIHAEVKPTGKAALVEAERAAGKRVAMVGDGINDAPALAAADLGVALATGTDIAAAAADVTLLRGGITALPTALSLSRATLRTIRRNLIAAFIYNAVCIPIAAAGLLSPVLASAAMSLSSVSVLLSSLRLRQFR